MHVTMVTIGMVTLFLAGIISVGGQYDPVQAIADMESTLTSSQINQESLRAKRWNYGNDPCVAGNHKILRDNRRNPSVVWERGMTAVNDYSIDPGWTRFTQDGQSAVIPTSCVPEKHCYTKVPVWLDLQGQSMPEEGEEVEALACVHTYFKCCFWDFPIKVLNCSDFYLYHLQRTRKCNRAFTAAYCAEPQN